MPFFQFRQNNSGGFFDVDEDVCQLVIIEADDPSEANIRAENIGIYFDGCYEGRDCPCCGDRWSPIWPDQEGDPVPSSYGTPLNELQTRWVWTDPFCIIHMKDGRRYKVRIKDGVPEFVDLPKGIEPPRFLEAS